MSLLFDTNAISEPVSARPDAGFMAWFSELSGDDRGPFTTSVTLAEVWQGWYRLPTAHRRRRDLRAWAEALPRAYWVVDFDERAARAWGEMTARLPKLPVRDSLIAAVALSRGLTVITRDTRPFVAAGCRVKSPWVG